MLESDKEKKIKQNFITMDDDRFVNINENIDAADERFLNLKGWSFINSMVHSLKHFLKCIDYLICVVFSFSQNFFRMNFPRSLNFSSKFLVV